MLIFKYLITFISLFLLEKLLKFLFDKIKKIFSWKRVRECSEGLSMLPDKKGYLYYWNVLPRSELGTLSRIKMNIVVFYIYPRVVYSHSA